MSIPTIHFSISGTVLALYGAILSTITATAQIIAHYRERAKIKIRVSRNMETMGAPSTDGMTFTIVNVINAGRRPVTIATIGAYRLHPQKPFVCPDTRPPLSHELTEGKQMMAMVDQTSISEDSRIEYWMAQDATGREHRLNVAPWFERWV
jgi:hypothetical protein